MSLKNKTALITGAGKGIGRALAIALAKEGVHVGLVARTAPDLEPLSALVAEQYGVRAVVAVADVSVQSEAEVAFAR